MMYKKLIFNFIILILTINLFANNYRNSFNYATKKVISLLPNDIKFQFAGNIGFLSIGANYHIFKNKFHSGIMYGVLNQEDTPMTIHTISLKNTFYIHKLNLYKYQFYPTMGININWSYTLNKFTDLPSYYKKSLRYENGLLFAPYIGAILEKKVDFKLFDSFNIYSELGTTHEYINAYMHNSEASLTQIMNLAVGITLNF